MPEINNADMVVPMIIIGVCLLLIILVWAFTRPASAAEDARLTSGAQAPIEGQTQVTAAQLGLWHRTHGTTVQEWIENHETVLKRVSDDGLSINLSDDLTVGHTDLGPRIDQAIAQHPAPQMRAQLSAMVLSSRRTIEALRRSKWSAAEKEHLTYLEYRDTWLDRLRQFTTAESELQQLRDITAETPATSWLDRGDSLPG